MFCVSDGYVKAKNALIKASVIPLFQLQNHNFLKLPK